MQERSAMGSNKDTFDPGNRGQLLIAVLSGGVNGFRFLLSPTYRSRVLSLWARKPRAMDSHIVAMSAGVLFYVSIVVLVILLLTHS
jgi:hypothetical protein